MTKIQNKNEAELNKKPAFETDSSESRNDTTRSVLTAIYSLADQKILSSLFVVDNYLNHGPAGNRTPEILLSRQISYHTEPTAFLLIQDYIFNSLANQGSAEGRFLYQKSKSIHNS